MYIDPDIDEFKLQASMLSEVVKRILIKHGDIELSDKPRFEKHKIVQFMKKMRVTGLTKFEERSFLSTVNFYLTNEDLEAGNSVGALIIYIPESYISWFMDKLEYPMIDEEDDDALEDGCGTFCNLIAGNFKNGLSQLGYQDLIMSHFSTYQNDVLNGVPYHPSQEEFYEINFEIRGEKRLVVDLSLGPIPKLDD